MEIFNTGDIIGRRVFGMIVGESGVGKTFLASTLDTKRTLFASAESGEMCLSSKNIRIDMVKIRSMEDMKKLYLKMMTDEWKAKYDNIYIDSMTEIASIILNELKLDPKLGQDSMALKMWGKFGEDLSKLVNGFKKFNHPYNIWFTCLNSFDKDGVVLKEEYNFPGKTVKANIKSWFDVVLKYQIIEHDGVRYRKLISDDLISPLAKDRSGNLSKYENPDLSAITTKVLGVSNGEN